MTKRISILLGIMLFCLLALLFMQGYLAYQEFQRQQADFKALVNELFAQSVQAEKSARVDRLVHLFMEDLDDPGVVIIQAHRHPEDELMVFDFMDPDTRDLGTSISFRQTIELVDTLTPETPIWFLEQMEKQARKDFNAESIVFWTDRLGERIKRNMTELPVDTATLHNSFRSKLDSLDIHSDFTIRIDSSFASAADEAMEATVRSRAHPLFADTWIEEKLAMAVIDNPSYAIFRRSIFTIAGSAAVILLTLLSFYLLFSTILYQKKLSEMKDNFIDNITHELQTPISALRLAVDSLRRFEVKDRPEKFASYLQISGTELNRLSELVESILLHSTGRESGEIEKESMDLMELLRAATDRYRQKAEKRVSVTLPDREEFPVVSSRFHLTTIIDNLLQNAIRYSDQEGVHIDVRLEHSGPGFVLEIADNGWGIAPEDRRHIFEKFYRSSDQDRNYTVKGTGIGLYHVQQCVATLGGKIQVHSNHPRGTIMKVIIEK
ncbi:sensor histidine kinase [Flavilitoribacter nigricans]|nr:HAMP domain-containing sensor histidine kinase [Flavilitoribacter nigricans]